MRLPACLMYHLIMKGASHEDAPLPILSFAMPIVSAAEPPAHSSSSSYVEMRDKDM